MQWLRYVPHQHWANRKLSARVSKRWMEGKFNRLGWTRRFNHFDWQDLHRWKIHGRFCVLRLTLMSLSCKSIDWMLDWILACRALRRGIERNVYEWNSKVHAFWNIAKCWEGMKPLEDKLRNPTPWRSLCGENTNEKSSLRVFRLPVVPLSTATHT